MAVTCDKFGFFNGIYALEQGNWSYFWDWVLPSGVIINQQNELQVYAQSDGMKVYVKTGAAMVVGHRVWVSSEKELPIAAAPSSNKRLDLVVLRIVFGNDGESTAELDVKTGEPAATPSAPTATTTIGGVYEIALATVEVGSGVATISSDKVFDRRTLITMQPVPKSFTGASVTPLSGRQYRNTASQGSMEIILPAYPQSSYYCSVDFVANASFTGITFKTDRNGTAPIVTDIDLKIRDTKYSLLIYWTGTDYRVIGGMNSGVHTTQGAPIVSFNSASVTCQQNRELRCTTALSSITITLPASPNADFIGSVRFPTSSSFSGVTVKKGTGTISGTTSLKLKGDALTLASKIYTLVFWWDGTYYWCASAAA